MTLRLTVVWGMAALLSSSGAGAKETREVPLAKSLLAFAKTCESKARVSKSAFERKLRAAGRERRGWSIAVQSEDAGVRLDDAKQIAQGANATVHLVSASDVVGKYIGETEKNLARLFESAQRNDWILFFDEADALFGKRSEVKDAHDRYADDAAATLPKRLSEYAGLFVLGFRAVASAPEPAADVVVPNRKREPKVMFPWKVVCGAVRPR